MAVHSVSLQWLAQQRRARADQDAVQRATVDAALNMHTNSKAAEGVTAPPGLEAGTSVKQNGQADLHRRDGVLGLSSAEFDRLLNGFGLQGGRALLALIYKLSAIESELSALRKTLEKTGPQKASEAPADHTGTGADSPPAPPAPEQDQPGILDQVFRNNLALWRKTD